mgnify:CR=1 FL=1
MRTLLRTAAVAALAGGLAFGGQDALAQSKILKSESGNPGSTGHALTTVMSKIYKRELGIDIQINDSQTLTKSALKLGRGQIDLMAIPTAVNHFLNTGSAMYKKSLHEEAIKASKNVRSLFGFIAVTFHPVTYEIDTIKTWQDIKGKRVFTGPPSGAAAVSVESMIEALTGYKPNVDYTAVRLNWGSGLQAMMDGKLDLFVRPVNPGAAMIEQLGLSKKFRLLDAGDAVNSEAFKKWEKRPGTKSAVIPAGTYSGQVNNDIDIQAGGSTFHFAVNASMDDEFVYKMTKSFWDNIKEVHETSVILRPISLDDPFVGINAPMHPGAIRYYKEKGIAVPDSLLPPAM